MKRETNLGSFNDLGPYSAEMTSGEKLRLPCSGYAYQVVEKVAGSIPAGLSRFVAL